MDTTPAQRKAARELLGWTREEVAEKLGMDKKRIMSAERRLEYRPAAADRLQALYEANGVEFTKGVPGAQLKASKKRGPPTAALEPSR